MTSHFPLPFVLFHSVYWSVSFHCSLFFLTKAMYLNCFQGFEFRVCLSCCPAESWILPHSNSQLVLASVLLLHLLLCLQLLLLSFHVVAAARHGSLLGEDQSQQPLPPFSYSHGLFLHNQNHIWFRLFFFHWQEAAWCTKSNEIAKHPFSYQHYAAVLATLCIFEKRNCCNLTCLVFSADSLNSHWVTYFFILENKWLPKTGLSQYHIFTPHLSCTKQFMIPISIEKSGYQSLGVRSS